MTDFLLTLKIDKVGDREALNALNDLDKKGREIIEGVSGATGRALGDVAVAYERGSATIKRQLQNIAEGHYENIAAMEAEQRAAEKALTNVAATHEQATARAERSTVAVSRALETMARTGKEGGRSLDTVIASLATGFGLGGPIVGAVGIATVAIVEMFTRSERAAKHAVDEMMAQFERLSDMDVKGQGEAASLLYAGKWNAKDPMDRPGIKGLRQEQADLEARIRAGTSTSIEGSAGGTGVVKRMTDDAKAAADQLDKVKAKLAEVVPLWQSMTGGGGSIQRAGSTEAAANLSAMLADQAKAEEAAQKAAQKAHDKAIKAFADGVEARQKERDAAVAAEVARLTDANDPNISLNANLDRALNRMYGKPSAAAQSGILAGIIPDADALKEDLKGIGKTVAEALKDDPFLKAKKEFDKSVKDLAKHMHEELQKTLGDALSAGFEAAFSGKGIGGAFEALTATVLAGLGGFMEQLGAQMIVVGVSLTALATSLLSLDGPGAIAAGVALVAAGAGLKAIAGSFGHGSASGGGGASSYGAGSSLDGIIDRGIINPDSYTNASAKDIQQRPSVTNNVTIIGPNDASAQRAWDELQRKSLQRGSLVGT